LALPQEFDTENFPIAHFYAAMNRAEIQCRDFTQLFGAPGSEPVEA
jgi:hypothetical protein